MIIVDLFSPISRRFCSAATRISDLLNCDTPKENVAIQVKIFLSQIGIMLRRRLICMSDMLLMHVAFRCELISMYSNCVFFGPARTARIFSMHIEYNKHKHKQGKACA